MTAILDVYLAMNDSLAATLGCEVLKGFPTWARTTAAPPVAALEMQDGPVQAVGRIGGQPVYQVGWRLYLFGRDEVELITMIDLFQGWLAATRSFVVNDSRIAVSVQAAERYDGDGLVQQEQHGWVVSLTTQW